MFSFLLFLSCAQEESSPQQKEPPPAPEEVVTPSSEQPSQEVTNTAPPTTPELPSVPEIPQVPKPIKIEGLATSKDDDPITAEELDAFLNKNKPKKSTNTETNTSTKEPETKTETETKNIIVENIVEEPKIYSVNFQDGDGEILIRVYKDTDSLGSSIAHDHVIEARGWEGQIIWNLAEPHNCLFAFRIPVQYLEVDPDRLRKRLSLPGVISKSDKKSIKKNMLAKSQLWSSKHPYINFHSSNCKIEDDIVIPYGTLDVRGTERKKTPRVKLSFDENQKKVETSFSITHTEFGFSPYSGLLGAVKNKDTIKITISLSK